MQLTDYWKEILIGLLFLIISASWYYDRSSLVKAMDSATSRYEQELLLIKESHARELERKDALVKEYEEKVKLLHSVFEENREQIKILKSDRVTEVTKLRVTDPDALAKQIEEAFGFTYVE